MNIKTNKNTVFTQGIFFREGSEMGVIIPKNDVLLEFKEEITITIWGKYFSQELEFGVSSKTYIGETEHLMYIPINDLKIEFNEITHINKAYNKTTLSGIRYCMESSFIFSNNYNTTRYVTYSYLKGFSKIPLENRSLNFLGRTESGKEIISVSDIQMFNGSPVVVEIFDPSKNTSTPSTLIEGILVTATIGSESISGGIGIFVTRDEILELLHNTL